jgi:7-carboxy-7-deazaguanine synthase
MKQNLVISEKFYSLQGEGATMGVPAVFLRLAGCNLLCKSAHWVCDSIEVWQKGVSTPFEKVFTGDLLHQLEIGAHLIITGGEPMLHQKKIEEYLIWFKAKHGFFPPVEIETNGTIMPSDWMSAHVFCWNCSPKLQNSGEPLLKRYKADVLRSIATMGQSVFKFVVDSEDDVIEIKKLYGLILKRHHIMLMPAGSTQKELSITTPIVAELCKKNSWRFSSRLQVEIWDKATGV